MDTIWVHYPGHSWHALRAFTRTGIAVTVCGRAITVPDGKHETRDDLPADKSCETCLRIVARREE